MRIFKAELVKCSFCKKKTRKNKSYKIVSNCADGVLETICCKKCAGEWDKMINDRNKQAKK